MDIQTFLDGNFASYMMSSYLKTYVNKIYFFYFGAFHGRDTYNKNLNVLGINKEYTYLNGYLYNYFPPDNDLMIKYFRKCGLCCDILNRKYQIIYEEGFIIKGDIKNKINLASLMEKYLN